MNKTVITIICAVWVTLCFYQLTLSPHAPAPHPEDRPRRVYDPALAYGLDSSLRDYWQQPDQVLDLLGDLNGLLVADIGAGEGYFTYRLADRVGDDGQVYATDIQAEVLETLEAGLPNEVRDRVTTIHTTGPETGIDKIMDLVLVVQVFGEITDRDQFINQLTPLMDADTRLVLIDSKHVTDPETGFTRPRDIRALIADLARKDLVVETRHGFLPKQYFLVLKHRPPTP